MSGLQSRFTPPARSEQLVPWYVYVSAILLLGWGLLVFSALLSRGEFDSVFWRAMVPVALELAVGCGLLLHQRWGWVLGVVASVVLIAEGLRRIVFVRGEFAVLVALVHYLVPAIVILASLLPGSARRAFLGERPAYHD